MMDDKLVERVADALWENWGQYEIRVSKAQMPEIAEAAIRAIEATRSSVTADDALRDDAEPMMPDAAFLGWLAGVLRSREFQSELVAERLERIASRLRSPSPDGEVTEE